MSPRFAQTTPVLASMYFSPPHPNYLHIHTIYPSVMFQCSRQSVLNLSTTIPALCTDGSRKREHRRQSCLSQALTNSSCCSWINLTLCGVLVSSLTPFSSQ